jgi:hypothetical protein
MARMGRLPAEFRESARLPQDAWGGEEYVRAMVAFLTNDCRSSGPVAGWSSPGRRSLHVTASPPMKPSNDGRCAGGQVSVAAVGMGGIRPKASAGIGRAWWSEHNWQASPGELARRKGSRPIENVGATLALAGFIGL